MHDRAWPDESGIPLLCRRTQLPCYTSIISGRFDVGGLQSYIECDDFFYAKEGGKKE